MSSRIKHEAGFSYIDVMIAITILLVGVMALVSAITNGVSMTTRSQQTLGAKQIASSTVESIFSARDIPGASGLGWNMIGNVGNPATPNGIFVTGRSDIYPSPGRDGFVGTADDAAGPDGQLGNADDGAPLPGWQREIIVTDIVDPDRPTSPITLRQIDVIIYYSVGSVGFQERFTSYIANYRTTVT